MEKEKKVSEKVPEKKSTAHLFQKGHAGGPGRGHKKPSVFGLDPIADLLHVYRSPSSEDKTEGHKAARKLLTTNYKGFLEMLMKSEGFALEAGSGTVTGAAAGVGEKEERVEELAERLLREWEHESAVQAR